MSTYGPRIAALERRYERERSSFSPTEATPSRGQYFLSEGAGQAIWLYVEGRTGGRMIDFSPAEFGALERAMNGWLELYARCYGVDIDAEFTVREAAELLLQTRNIFDVAAMLTQVPGRDVEQQ